MDGSNYDIAERWQSYSLWILIKRGEFQRKSYILLCKQAIVHEMINNSYVGSKWNFNPKLVQNLMDGEEMKMGKCVIIIRDDFDFENEQKSESLKNEYDDEEENKMSSIEEVRQNHRRKSRKFKVVTPGEDRYKLKMQQKRQNMNNHNFDFQRNYHQNQYPQKSSFRNARNQRNRNREIDANRAGLNTIEQYRNFNNSYYQNPRNSQKSRNMKSKRVSTEKTSFDWNDQKDDDDGFGFDNFDFHRYEWNVNGNRNGNGMRNNQQRNRKRKKRNFDEFKTGNILDYIQLNNDLPRNRKECNDIYVNQSCQPLTSLLNQRKYDNDGIPETYKDPFQFGLFPRRQTKIIKMQPIDENIAFSD